MPTSNTLRTASATAKVGLIAGWGRYPIVVAEALRRDQEVRVERAIARFQTARPPGGIDIGRLYEENLIDGVVFHASSD